MRNYDNSPTTERMRPPTAGRFTRTTVRTPRHTRRDRVQAAAVQTAYETNRSQ